MSVLAGSQARTPQQHCGLCCQWGNAALCTLTEGLQAKLARQDLRGIREGKWTSKGCACDAEMATPISEERHHFQV